MRAMRSDRPTSSPAWGPPTSLSPLKQTRSAPDARRSIGVGSWASPKAAVSSNAPEPRSSTTTAPSSWAIAASAAGSASSTKPSIRKLDGWTRRTATAAAGLECLLVVGDPGPVRGADLDEPQPGASDDVRDAHATADLDELAASDGDALGASTAGGRPSPVGSHGGGQRQRDRSGVVVGDQRVLGAGQGDEVRLGRPEPGAALAGGLVHLQQRRALGGRCGSADGRLGPRRASEIRVQDDAGRVHDRHQIRARASASSRDNERVGERLDGGRRRSLTLRRSRSSATTSRAAATTAP